MKSVTDELRGLDRAVEHQILTPEEAAQKKEMLLLERGSTVATATQHPASHGHTPRSFVNRPPTRRRRAVH